jgi:hypothetical protein
MTDKRFLPGFVGRRRELAALAEELDGVRSTGRGRRGLPVIVMSSGSARSSGRPSISRSSLAIARSASFE